MSDEAFGWLKTIAPPDALSRAVLKELCGYADPLGVAWAAVPTLAFDLMKSERQIQRALRALEKAGLMKATGRFHHRNVPYYQLAIDQPGERAAERAQVVARIRAEASGRRRKPVSNGDMGVTVEKPNGDMGVTANGDMGVTQHQGTTSSDVSDETSSERGGAGEALRVEEVAFAAYPEIGRRGRSSLRNWRAAWASEVAGGADPLALLRAVQAYAADRKAWGSSGQPVAAHTFLAEGRWEAFVGAPLPGGAAVAANGVRAWSGPAEIRAQLAARGEGFIATYLDPARWDGAAIVAFSRYGAGQLRQALQGKDITVKDPPG